MGSGYRGNYGNTVGYKKIKMNKLVLPRNKKINGLIENNTKSAAKLFDFDNGVFGIKNRNPRRKPREIIVKNTKTSSAIFFNTLSAGSKKEIINTKYGKAIKATLIDDSVIIYRPTTSSRNSPAVEIVKSNSEYVLPRKYHLVEEGSNI